MTSEANPEAPLHGNIALLRQLLDDVGAFDTGLHSGIDAMAKFFAEFKEAESEFHSRYGKATFNLLKECTARPSDYKVLLQSFVFSASKEVRCLLIRLSNHGRIKALTVDYKIENRLTIAVELDSAPYEAVLDSKTDCYNLTNPVDFMILTRMSVALTSDGKPLLHGPIPWEFPTHNQTRR